jgi:hypothetical protein
MIPVSAPPELNPLVDSVFDALPEPEGFEFECHDGHYLWPVFGQDQWRMVMKHKQSEEKIPVFFSGNLIRFLSNALKRTYEEITKAVPPRL